MTIAPADHSSQPCAGSCETWIDTHGSQPSKRTRTPPGSFAVCPIRRFAAPIRVIFDVSRLNTDCGSPR